MSNSDDTNELDNYGVWVKKPPKDIPVDNSELMDDSFDIDADLPDFNSLDESTDIIAEEPVVEETASEAAVDDFDISVDGITEESLDDPFADVDFGKDSSEALAEEPAQDDIFTEESVEAPVSEETKADEIPEDDFNLDDITQDMPLDDINFDVDSDISLDETPAAEEPAVEEKSEDIFVEETAVEEPSLDDFNVEEITETPKEETVDFEIDDNVNTEIATETSEINLDEMQDGEIDLDNFLDDSSSSDSASDGDSVDVSADFGLDDSSTDSVDLGDFLGDDDLGDFGGAPKAKSEEIVEEEPLDINLSFDESANSFAVEETDTETNTAEVKTEEERTTGDEIDTESIDLSDFGVGDEEDSGFTGPEDAINEEKQEVVDYDMKVTADSDDDVTVSMSDVISGNIENDMTQETSEIEETPVAETKVEDTEISAKGQEILQQIVGELASLKDEIKNLKNDFAEIKTHGADFEIKNQEEENTGFFSDGDEDDTIALSGDELSNILNNAEFLDESAEEETEETAVEEPADNEMVIEEPVSEETVVEEPAIEEDIFTEEPADSETQFESTIEDNAFDDSSIFDEHADEDIQLENPEISEELPDEIEIPKIDDESDDFSADEPILETDVSSETIEESNDEIDPIDSILSEDVTISDSLTTDKIDYISEDSENPVKTDEFEDLDLPSPTIEEEPVIEETSVEEPVIEETPAEETVVEDDLSIFEEKAPETPVVSNDEITGDLKSEIKSVLSYMDQLLENLPEDKISEFAQSEHFVTYKKLFQELGLS